MWFYLLWNFYFASNLPLPVNEPCYRNVITWLIRNTFLCWKMHFFAILSAGMGELFTVNAPLHRGWECNGFWKFYLLPQWLVSQKAINRLSEAYLVTICRGGNKTAIYVSLEGQIPNESKRRQNNKKFKNLPLKIF